MTSTALALHVFKYTGWFRRKC